MASGARSKFGAPMFELELFRNQIYCIEETTHDIFWTFRRLPQWFGARGIVPPLPLTRYAPESKKVVHEQKDKKYFRNTNILNYFPSFDSSSVFLVLTPTTWRNFRSDGPLQDRSCTEINQ